MDITATDLLSNSHILIVRNAKKTVVREFENGQLAHAEALRLARRDEFNGEIVVCCRVQTLTAGSYKFRHVMN